MELNQVNNKIEDKIHLLEKCRSALKDLSKKRAETVTEYDKILGITLLKLKNNAIEEYEGFPCVKLPMAIIEKVAKGICWKERLEMERSDTEFKLAMKAMDSIQQEMLGYQSIYRYQNET